MTCPACGHDNREAARFCDSCGRPLEARCPACGQPARPGARFCDGCGTPLAPSSVQPAAASRAPASYTPHHLAERILKEGRALRGERKEVTVLFVDVQGSTELAGALDPEEFHSVMDGAFQLMLDAVHRWEGTVNQFTGDGLLAVFGAPLAHEDHARRACLAVLEVQREVAQAGRGREAERWGRVRSPVGLNSGEVVVGAIGDDVHMDFVPGHTTALATRIEELAARGVDVDQRIHRHPGRRRVRAVASSVSSRSRACRRPSACWTLVGAERRRPACRPRRHPRAVAVRRRATGSGPRWSARWEHALAGHGRAVGIIGEPRGGQEPPVHEFCRCAARGLAVELRAGGGRARALLPFRRCSPCCVTTSASTDATARGRPRAGRGRRCWDSTRRARPTCRCCSSSSASLIPIGRSDV